MGDMDVVTFTGDTMDVFKKVMFTGNTMADVASQVVQYLKKDWVLERYVVQCTITWTGTTWEGFVLERLDENEIAQLEG